MACVQCVCLCPKLTHMARLSGNSCTTTNLISTFGGTQFARLLKQTSQPTIGFFLQHSLIFIEIIKNDLIEALNKRNSLTHSLADCVCYQPLLAIKLY